MKVLDKVKRPVKSVPRQAAVIIDPHYFSLQEIELFKQGAYFTLYQKMGAHFMKLHSESGVYFSVWAPNAKSVSVIGNFNNWNKAANHLKSRTDFSGIWEGFIPGVTEGDLYKFHITSKKNGYTADKADPLARYGQEAPDSASIVKKFHYRWNDQDWMKRRRQADFTRLPMSVYEVHFGSWRRRPNGTFKGYRELAPELVSYVKDLGFTHIELMPLMEHPFYGSWGYQALSYFAPTARYGSPEDLMYFIDYCHQNGIGVILDWVVSHFPSDDYGLSNFDGTGLYEIDGLHPDWQSCVFNLGRHETIEFLISSALFWMEKYHIDGLRVDAVASMLYLDYSRKDGEWQPNIFGGRENLEAISFIRRLNEAVKTAYPGVQMIAEDSTAWPNVSRPSSVGGLNFDMKWNMGWMHDTIRYFQHDMKERGNYHQEVAFCLYYAFSENFVLSLSHDEVVYEKGSLISKMPGKDWEKFANLRALYGYMYSHPGKKLLFMGSEFAQWSEWNHDGQLDWSLLEHDRHRQIHHWVKSINRLYQDEPALHELDFSPQGFEWLDMGLNMQSIFSFLRKGTNPNDDVLVICNLKNRVRRNYTVGIPSGGMWKEILNSDDRKFGGKGIVNTGNLSAVRGQWIVRGFGYYNSTSHNIKDYSLTVDLPPLGVIFLKKFRD